MKIIGIIPARYASTRFPGKPLIDIAGKTMIQRVYEQAAKSSSLNNVVVATDDERIAKHVDGFNGKYLLTSPLHQSGTDRCAEVISRMTEYDIAVNIQGDEPYIAPEQIDLLCQVFRNPEVNIATLIKKITSQEELLNINSPKVLIDTHHRAIYFSRNPLPHIRGIDEQYWLAHHTFYKHIGIYGYRCNTLRKITKLKLSSLEKAEGLEQLRWLENGYAIHTSETHFETLAVDIPSDVDKITKNIKP